VPRERRYIDARRRSALIVVCVALIATVSSRARAQPVPPAPHEDEAFDIMNELSHRGLHDIHDETWNLYGQYTYITSYKPPIHAPYTNVNGSPNSLWPQAERGFTGTFTLFGGLRLWPGAEAYVVPEFIAERAFSTLHGLGGSTENFELQKTGAESPTLYRSRLFLRQAIDLGGKPVEKTSDPMQIASTVRSRRIVLTAGNFSALDIFDRNNVVGDLRQSFFNEAFMTHASWDFPADARGYTWGATVELYLDDWVVRFGRLAPPANPNSYPLDVRLWKYFGDQLEIEHDHMLFGRPGAVRLLAYRNYEVLGRFDDAVAALQGDPTKNAAACTSYNYGSGNFRAPDFCWVRRPQVKVGVGINVEQYVADGIGVFARAMYSDGRTEVDAFDSADRDLSLGVVAKGKLWKRPFDVTGAAFAVTWISNAHARYMALGGIDAFTGDGRLDRSAPEELFDAFYSFNLFKAIWLAADYQFLANPAYNPDRGPEHVISGRFHAEF
jgi:high affinity Mn2+ porin